MKNRSSLTIFATILCVLACFGLAYGGENSPAVKAQASAGLLPLTDLGHGNTADGNRALSSVTTGSFNSAFGWFSLFGLTTAEGDTGVGAGALALDNAGINTAVGAGALFLNKTAVSNNAVGFFALEHNDSDGSGLANYNNSFGRFANGSNVDGTENAAFGDTALEFNTASHNTGIGDNALDSNTTGDGNTAVGRESGDSIVDGSNDIAIGHFGGASIVHASHVIAIGAAGISSSFGDASDTCYIGSIFGRPVGVGPGQAVYVDSDNVLGFTVSSRRVKHDIKPMDKASEALYALKPVTFKYNTDKKGTPCFGLIAEEVAEVNGDLVILDKEGKPSSVRYEQINAMLLNEFLKEHRRVEELQAGFVQQQKEFQTIVGRQQKQIEALTAGLQKVSAQLEVSKPVPQTVLNNQ